MNRRHGAHPRGLAIAVFVALVAGCAANSNPSEITEGDVSISAIVGGDRATAEQFPFFVSVLVTYPTGRRVCGGTHLGEGWILTAAHCVDDPSITRVDVFAMNDTFARVIHGVPDARATESVIHPRFCDDVGGVPNANADIALLRLDRDLATVPGVEAAQHFAPASDAEARRVGAPATAIGLGLVSLSGDRAVQLQRVDLALQEPGAHPFLSEMLRAGGTGQSTCVGDSGGPLVARRYGGWLQLGVTSRGPVPGEGERCGDHSYFTDVGKHRAWIAEVQRTGSGGVSTCTFFPSPAEPEPEPEPEVAPETDPDPAPGPGSMPEGGEGMPTPPPEPSPTPAPGREPVTGAGTACASGGRLGLCIDTSSTMCEGALESGLCPGPSQVRCCLARAGVGTACSSGGDSGTCIDTTTSSCSGRLQSGVCPGPGEVRCCLR